LKGNPVVSVCPEDEHSRFFRNGGNDLPGYTASYSMRIICIVMVIINVKRVLGYNAM
jgi:hypothetical protein